MNLKTINIQNNFKKTTLSNNITVLTDSMNQVESIAVEVCIKVGSRYENEPQNGIAHFLEHMFFKGTKTRSAKMIAEEFDSFGGYINAHTSRESTSFTARFLASYLDQAMDIIADLVQNSIFDEEELAKEKEVVLQEIAQSLDNYSELVYDNLLESCYPNHPLGRPILGPADTVKSLTSEGLKDFINNYYNGSSIFIGAAGKVEHSEFAKVIEKYFGNIPKGEKNNFVAAKFTNQNKFDYKDIEQVNIMLGFEGISYLDDKYFSYELFSSILGGSISSRLFQEIREKRGLVYSVSSFTSNYKDTGIFGIYAGTTSEKVEELLVGVKGEMEKIASNIEDKEIARTLAQVKSALLMENESVYRRCSILVSNFAHYGRYISAEEVLEKYQQVTKNDLLQIGQKFLNEKKLSISIVGNYEREKQQYFENII